MKVAIPDEAKGAFVPRPRNANKYTVGTVALIGGSVHYPHAPVMAAMGARAAGAGLVQLVVPDASRIAAGVWVPEATFTKLATTCVPPKADVIAIGMGLGINVNTQALVSRILSGSNGRFVVDADALGILAGWYGKTDGYDPAQGQELVLTPHEGEAARLLGWSREKVSSDRRAAAIGIADRYGATVVLKGPETLVVSSDAKKIYVNETGNPCMALGGMGDLLAGVLAARWAYSKGDAFEASCAAVWLHGAAGDETVARGKDPSIANIAETIGEMRTRIPL